jgi:predicted transcriptional regulator
MSVRISDLGELQLAVLNVLWSCQEAVTVHEVLAGFPTERKLAYTTILTVLRNLEKRGLVAHTAAPGARMFRYRPLLTVEEARRALLQDLLQRLFDGSPVLLVSQLLTLDGWSLEDLRAIREVVKAQERALSEESAS